MGIADKEMAVVHNAVKTNIDKRLKQLGMDKTPIHRLDRNEFAHVVQIASLEALTDLWFQYKTENNKVGVDLVTATIANLHESNKTTH